MSVTEVLYICEELVTGEMQGCLSYPNTNFPRNYFVWQEVKQRTYVGVCVGLCVI